MDTIHMPSDIETRIASAIEFFWTTRKGQITRQTANGVRDQGNRGAVTGGKQLDVFYRYGLDNGEHRVSLRLLNPDPEYCVNVQKVIVYDSSHKNEDE